MMVVATLETGTSSCFSHRDPGDREVDERMKAWPLTCNRDGYREDVRPERLSRAECSRKHPKPTFELAERRTVPGRTRADGERTKSTLYGLSTLSEVDRRVGSLLTNQFIKSLDFWFTPTYPVSAGYWLMEAAKFLIIAATSVGISRIKL
jgi:hypothetical protein